VHAQNVAPHFIKFTNREMRQISLCACKITVLLNQCCYAFVIGLLLSSCSLHSFAHPVWVHLWMGLKGCGQFRLLCPITLPLYSLSPLPPLSILSFTSWQILRQVVASHKLLGKPVQKMSELHSEKQLNKLDFVLARVKPAPPPPVH